MKYYKLIFDFENDKDYLLAEPCHDMEDEYIVCEGKAIEKWEPMQFECDIQNGRVITEKLGNSYGWEILSEKALELFGEIIGNDVQLLPIKVVNKHTEQEIEKYFVVNVLPFLDALDLENSVYNYFDVGSDEKLLSVIKYGIKEKKVGGHHIFRLKESPMAVFVSGKFKEIAEKNDMLGFDFVKVKVS